MAWHCLTTYLLRAEALSDSNVVDKAKLAASSLSAVLMAVPLLAPHDNQAV